MPKFLNVEVFRLNQIEKDYIKFEEFMSDYGLYASSKQVQAELLYAMSLSKTAKALSTGSSRIPNLAHDLIECSVCHKLIEEPNIDMCEFCDEDVCDNCWDKHQCDQELARYE